MEDFLSTYLSSLVASGIMLPILFPQGVQSPTHMLYADGVLLFVHGIVCNLRVIVDVYSFLGHVYSFSSFIGWLYFLLDLFYLGFIYSSILFNVVLAAF